MATGTYDIETLVCALPGRLHAYDSGRRLSRRRRPEGAYVLERLVDQCARALKIAPEEIRARNFVKPSQMPYHTQTNRTYDVGDFEGAMRASLAKADYAGFGARAEAARKRGLIRGIGLSSYIECTAWGDGEEGSVELGPDGNFTAY